jgi:hypothetical protein
MGGITIKSDLRLKTNYQQSGEISGKKKKRGWAIQIYIQKTISHLTGLYQ